MTEATGRSASSSGAGTTVAGYGGRVAGFYRVAASAVERRCVPSRFGRSIPEPVPVTLFGQLAVDTRYRGRGIGPEP